MSKKGYKHTDKLQSLGIFVIVLEIIFVLFNTETKYVLPLQSDERENLERLFH